ncbi:MAG: type II secretion system protein GspG [Spirochaetales bacterium]|nr:type II secretion system protein GspG [Spirochaetales bacterium]
MNNMLRNLMNKLIAVWKNHTRDFVYKKGNRGATFVEIIVTISIILILMTSVGVAIFRWIPQAQIAATKQTMGSIKLGLDMYYTTHFEYPDTLEAITEFLDPPELPKDAWGTTFVYMKSPTDEIPYELVSYGQDKSEGGEGPAADISLNNNNSGEEDSE